MSVARSNASSVNTTDIGMSEDAKVMAKLRKHFLARGANGVPVLAPSYLMLERDISVASNPTRMNFWDLKRMVRKVDVSSASDKDIDMWLRTRVVQGGGADTIEVVDAVALLVDLRLMLHCTQQQIDDIVRKLRCHRSTVKLPPAERVDRVLTLPEKFFLMHYLENDLEYLSDLLAESIPVDIVYPCLLNKLLDAVIVVDNGKTFTGAIGILKCLKFAPCATHAVFKKAMKDYQCGLIDGEIDSLFGFVTEQNEGDEEPMVNTIKFLNIVQEKLQSIAFCSEEQNIQRILQKVRVLMKRGGGPGTTTFPMVAFHNHVYPMLSECVEEDNESDFGLMVRFADMLRSYGVMTSSMPDIDIELLWYHLQGAAQGIINTMCLPLPPQRSEVVDHAYEMIASACENTTNAPLTLSYILQHFRVPPRYPATILEEFQQFFKVFNGYRVGDVGVDHENPHDVISHGAFRSYWECISFSIENDGEFNMFVWNALQLQRLKGRVSK